MAIEKFEIMLENIFTRVSLLVSEVITQKKERQIANSILNIYLHEASKELKAEGHKEPNRLRIKMVSKFKK